MDIDEFTAVLDKFSLKQNEFADLRGYRSESLNFEIRRGEIQQTLSQKLSGVGIRVLANGAWGFVSITETNSKSLRDALEKAYKLANSTGMRVKKKIITETDKYFAGKHVFKADINPKDISIEEKYSVVKTAERTIKTYNPQIVNSSASWEEMVQKEIVVNTNGTNVESDYGVFRLGLDATSRRADIIQNVSDRIASSAGLKTILDTNIEEQAETLSKRAVRLLDAKSVPKGRNDILMDPSLVGVYIHEAFGHASEGDAILGNMSVLRGKIGKQLGIEAISVVDDPTIPGLRGSYSFDSEGSPTIKRDIVKNGILLGYLNSLETSKRLSNEFIKENDSIEAYSPYQINGAGRAQDFRHVVMPRMSNTYIKNGDYSFEELLEEIGNGVYLSKSYGGYVQPVKGEFYFTSQGGFLIEDGELTDPIRNSAMSGLTLEVLNKTIAIGNDLDFAFQGVCGKPSSTGIQNLAVSAGGPHLAVRQIVIG